MARFTFSGGNARKLAALPLYGLGSLAARVVRRQPRLWVFGSGTGVGEGALPLLLHARATDKHLRLVWMARDRGDLEAAAALGIRAVRKSSWRGFRLTLRASVIVVTHGFGDVNRFGTSGGYVVQLWHGIPFKKIHLDSPATLHIPLLSRLGVTRGLLRSAYRRSTRGISLFAAASPLAAARIRSAFGLDESRVVVTGDPRDDVLAAAPAGQPEGGARARLLTLLADSSASDGRIPEFARVLLYAPTWRDGKADPVIPGPADWARLRDYLETSGSLLVIRSHPLGVGDYSPGLAITERVRMLGVDLQADITPLLPAFDAVITDYSSIAYDYALTGGELLFLAPDIGEYANSHGVYETYSDFSGGSEVASWAALITLLEESDRDPTWRAALRDHTRWLAGRMHSFNDGRNAARVYDQILARWPQGGASSAANPAQARLATGAKPMARVPLTVDEITLGERSGTDEPELTVGGTHGGHPPTAAQLEGSRLVLNGSLESDHTRWTVRIPLLSSRWNSRPLPPPSGGYALRVAGADGRRLDLAIAANPLPPQLRGGLFRLGVTTHAASVTVNIAAPLEDFELGAVNQGRFQARYRRSREPLHDAVFFESFYGSNASCNPRAIDREIARLRPDIERFWSVADASVEIPDGATAVIEGSAEWWQARGVSRLYVVNDWLRKRYRRRAGQAVLQTWHGTPLKRIALDRSRVMPRTRLATLREKSRWQIMLAQNEYSAEIFRSAYAVRAPIWQEGYPRNDILQGGDSAAVRERLGIEPATRILLYAPTWRDDRPGRIDHLDVARFAQALGPGFITLIRGHSRTMQPGIDITGPGVLDVTGYPDIAELFLVADALITDYSSAMFDFTVTGKPIYFFTPDLEHYRDQLRGFYFDLFSIAPGPIVSEPGELVELIRSGGTAITPGFEEAYSAWRRRFNPQDDGDAAGRVARRLLAEGLLG